MTAGSRPSLKAVKAALRRELPRLREVYGVRKLSVFGSTVHGKARKGSDVDLLVEFHAPIGLIRFVELENRLSKVLGLRVDLVMRKALKPRIGRRILQEALPI